VTQNFTQALLVAAVLSCTALAGCSAMDGKKDTTARQTARQPAAAPGPAAGQPATTDQESAGQSVDDAVVTAKVKARLVDDEVTKASQIEVATFKGVVQLSGSVDSEEARSRAVELAKNVGGVKDVKDSLQVRRSDG
jgi:osmotically-inducible protein OsmY